MSLNLFGKTYLAPDYLYDNGYNRILFSKERNQAEYLNYESFEFTGLAAKVVHSSKSIYDIIGEDEGQYTSVAHYINHLHDCNFDGRIYADEESWIALFYTWTKISMPNIDDESAFIIYNIVKQREELVFPDNRDLKSFIVPRIAAKSSNLILTKDQFVSKFNELRLADSVTSDYYAKLNEKLKFDLCVEIQLASYFSNQTDISILSDKIKIIFSKLLFGIVDDLRIHVRENIMSEKVRQLTGITLLWEDQNWEDTLRAKSSEINFLFDSSYDALMNDFSYRYENLTNAFYWCQWIVDNTDIENIGPEWQDLYHGAKWTITNAGIYSEEENIRNAAVASILQEDLDFSLTTIYFQGDYLREKINTFWIEYVYQLSKLNNIEVMKKISHT